MCCNVLVKPARPKPLLKSLHQRKKEYEEARARIFMEESKRVFQSRNFKKIQAMREKRRQLKRIRLKIISTIVTLKGDNRLFAKTKIDGEEVVALLDSGASANCIGKGAMDFLKNKEHQIISLSGQNVRTADGGETPVIGVVTLPVLWDGVTKDMEFLIVPALQQEVYFGVDFWRTFKMEVVSRGSISVCAKNEKKFTTISELTSEPSCLCFDTNQHVLSSKQLADLERVKAIFPCFATLGLGRTDVEEHVIEVVNENVPMKQRHCPI